MTDEDDKPDATKIDLNTWEPSLDSPNKHLFKRHGFEFEAVRFTGTNYAEIRAFVGTRIAVYDGSEIQIFNPIGTFLPTPLYEKEKPQPTAELWTQFVGYWKPVYVDEWIVQQEDGFLSVTDEWMMANNMMLDEEMLALLREEQRPKTFQEDLVTLLNRHSMENYSGTPDWILAEFVRKCLEAWDLGIRLRADWRSESTELPALNDLRGGREKEVPLVIYTNGQRNEVGIAKVKVTPGEMVMTDEITGALPIFGKEGISVEPGLEIATPKDEPQPTNRFDRYQKEGLTTDG